jgi:hypothetical protein
MAANGISTLSTKQDRQIAKLELAKLKREGYTLNADGSIASGPDVTKIFYRERNQYDITELPTQYSGNGIFDNPNDGGLVIGRPWTIIVAEPFGLLTEDSDPITEENNEPLEG